MAKATHEVIHKRLFLSVGGKLQLVPAGSEITLTKEQADSMPKGRVMKVGEKKQVVVDSGEKA